MGSHQATLEEDVTLLNGQTSSSLTGRTSGLPHGQLTYMGNKDESNRPVWTPDGKRIGFCSDKEGPTNIYWQLADGSGGLEEVDHQRKHQRSDVFFTGWADAALP